MSPPVWFLAPLLCLCLGTGAQDNSQRGLPPPSPCPNVYSYGWDPSQGWYGIITILPPARFSEIQLIVRLTVPYYKPELGVGRVDVKGGTREIQAISNRAYRGERHQVQYHVIFPPFEEVPRIKELYFNGKSFCVAKDALGGTKNTIELKYVLKSGLNLPLANGNEFSIVNANKPSHPSRPGSDEVIYVIQGQDGAYIIPGSQLTSTKPTPVTRPPFIPPLFTLEPTTQSTTLSTTLSTTPSTTPSEPEDMDYWDIFSKPPDLPSGTNKPAVAKPPHPKPDGSHNPTTPRPKPSTSRRPRPKPKPKPTTPPTSGEITDQETQHFKVNGLNCGVPTVLPNFLVVNGVSALKGQWPWQSAIFKTSSTGLTFQCGGTLVSKRHIITAGHCVYLKDKMKPVLPDTILVYLGKHNLRSWTEAGQQAKDVDKIIIHPNYGKKNFDFDVSILILSTPAEFTEFVLPVCLWDKSPTLNSIVNKPGMVVGWGRDEHGETANELKMAKMPVVSQETCLRSDTFFATFTSDVTYCAGYRNGTSVCNGDSGGGMFFYLENPKQHTKTWYTRGVVSISKVKLQESDQLCDTNSYVVFTDLAKLLPWLRQQLAVVT